MKTPLDKKLIGDQDKLPEALKAKIEAAPDSPANFMAGIAAGLGSLGGSSGYADALQGPLGQRQGILDAARRLAATNKQRRLPNGVMNAAQAPPTTVGSQDPLNDFSGQKFEITPVQMKNENYIPGNEQGDAKPLFTDKTKQVADGIFGKRIPGTFDSALPKKNCNKKY
mgnify:CR=1 FL=1